MGIPALQLKLGVHRGLLSAPHALSVGLVCFVTSYAAVMLTRGTHGIAALWISNAVLLAALLLRPSAFLRLFLSGSAAVGVANLLSGDDLITAIGLLAANSADVLVSYILMRRFDVGRFAFGTLAFQARFLPICGLIGPAVSATLGAAVASTAFGSPYLAVWLSWFSSCSLGTIIVGPLLIAFWRTDAAHLLSRQTSGRLPWLGMIAGLCFVNFIVFGSSSTPIPLLPFSVVVVATVIFGQRMGSAGIVLTAFAGLASLVAGTGPLMNNASLAERVLMLQGYLAVLTLTCLPIAAVLQERRALSDQLALAEARHRLLSEGSGDAILLIDRDGIVLHASRAVTDLTGLMPDRMVGHPGVAFVHCEDRAEVTKTHTELMANGGAATVRYRYTHQRDGDERWLEVRTRAILAGDIVSGAISTIRDVTLLVAQERRMTQEAETDPLTGLSNRRHFMAKLEQALTNGEAGSVAVAMLDVDHFKQFNDRYGHAAGDAVLCAVARAANAALRPDDLIGRLGGDEFAMLLPQTGEKGAVLIAGRVRNAVAAQAVIFAGEVLRVTVSVGAAVSGPVASDAAALLAAADTSLYIAKNSGRDCVKSAA